MSIRRSAYLVVRPTAADVLHTDPLDGTERVILSGHPATPASWQDSPMSGGWSQHVTPPGVVLHALRLNTDQTNTSRGIWIVVQREPDGSEALTDLANHASNTYGDTLKNTWNLAREGDAVARALLRHWPDWKVTELYYDEDDAIQQRTTERRIFARDSGIRVPSSVFTNAFPWHLRQDGTATVHGAVDEEYHVQRFHRPALLQTIAGYADETPEEGTEEQS